MLKLQEDGLASVVPDVVQKVSHAWTEGHSFETSLIPASEEAEGATTVLLDPDSVAIVKAVTTVAAVAEHSANRMSAALQQSLTALKSEMQSAVMQVRNGVTQKGAQLSDRKSFDPDLLTAAQMVPGIIPEDITNTNAKRLTNFDAEFDIDAITREVENGQQVAPPIPPERSSEKSKVQEQPCKTSEEGDVKLRDDEFKPSTPVMNERGFSLSSLVGIAAEDTSPYRESRHAAVYSEENHAMQRKGAKSELLRNLDDEDEIRRTRGVFIDACKVKEDVKRSLMQPVYKVTDFYKTTGWPQMICRSARFDNCVLVIIVLNGFWLGIDTEYNEADIISKSHPVFIVADQFFCIFFTTELVLRFLAFEVKHNCCKDKWFVFDATLVAVMALESWILNCILLFSGHNTATSQGILQNTSLLRLFRLIRLFRLARLAKLMRAMPEIMIIVNGLLAAIRTVFFTLLLLVCLVYVFAVAFTTMAKGTRLGEEYFETVYHSMFTFFVLGAFPDLYEPLQTMVDEGILYFFAFLVYGILASVAIMNMLIGVLVDVVNSTSEVERESMDVEFLRDKLLQELEIFQMCDTSDPSKIVLDKAHVFEILSSPLAAQSLSAVGVDVIAFLELLEYVFTMCSQLSFPAFVETALQFRSSKFALVKDIVDLRRYLKYEMEQIVDLLDQYHGQRSPQRTYGAGTAMNAASSIVQPLRTLEYTLSNSQKIRRTASKT